MTFRRSTKRWSSNSVKAGIKPWPRQLLLFWKPSGGSRRQTDCRASAAADADLRLAFDRNALQLSFVPCFRMTTANKITIVRILMIPVFVTMAIYYGQSIERGAPLEWQRFTAIIIFLVAAASDGLDGYVARRYKQRSALGAILDPIADKGLLLSA